MRGIPDRIEIDYAKKARGTLNAHGSATVPDVSEPTATQAVAEIRDDAGDVVATVRVRWQLERVA